MNNDINLEIVSEILEGVSIVESSFGILYFKHLSQQEQRQMKERYKNSLKFTIPGGMASYIRMFKDLHEG